MSLFLSGFLLKGWQKLDCQLLTCLFAADNKGINYFHIKTELLLFLIMLGLRLPCFTCMVAPRGHAWDTMRYRDMINEQAVCILLECILVSQYFHLFYKVG